MPRARAHRLQVYAARGWPVDFYTKYSSCFQIKHCPNNLTSEDAAALTKLESDGNVFHSSSLAEWGYSFHSLQFQGNMGWWHAVLPNTTNTTTHTNTNTSMFDTLYKEDATPPGMAGYWTYPEDGSRALVRTLRCSSVRHQLVQLTPHQTTH